MNEKKELIENNLKKIRVNFDLIRRGV